MPDIILPATDVEATVRFYCDAFGFECVHADAEFANIGGEYGTMFVTRRDSVPADGVVLYLSVESVDETFSRLEAMNAATDAPSDKPYGMREANGVDPDGRIVTVAQPL